MKVICAGAPKTGTKSMAAALRRLGYKTYDFMEQIDYFNEEWHALFARGKIPDFKAMFDDVDAVTDTPASIVYEEIAECFPEAKVVLTVRDEESWLRSVKDDLSIIPPWMKVVLYLGSYKLYRLFTPLNESAFGTRNPNASFLHRKRYRCHNERVKQVIPKERLLVFNLEQGWKPLCEFLGHEIPDEPFPRANVKGSITKQQAWRLVRNNLLTGSFVLVLLIGIVLCVCRL